MCPPPTRTGGYGEPVVLFDGLLDCGAPLRAGHAGDEIETGRHRFRQIAEACTLADEVGAHGQAGVDRQLVLSRRLEDQLDEGCGIIARVGGARGMTKTEQLLELVDDDENILRGCRAREANGFY